jgi:hypothetical protein
MSITVANSGEACCGNCGAHVVVACSGGCENPDVQFRENYIASLPVPRSKELPRIPVSTEKPIGTCTYRRCTDPIAPRKPGVRGRAPKTCEKHLAQRAKFRKPKALAA